MPWRALRPEWIDSRDRLAAWCARASETRPVAVDTEADSMHSYFHKLCLVQLAAGESHALVDPLALGREGMTPLVALLGDASVTKVMHGADYDLRVLDRDLGARVVGVRDTQIAAQLLGERQTSLAALVEKELGVTLDKRFQTADWGQRPLPPELLAYASGDTAFLQALAEKLAARLGELGRFAWWEEECEALRAIRWEQPEPDPRAFERLKGAKALRGAARDRVAALHAWREATAAALDVPPFKVLGREPILAMSSDPPADQDALAKVAGIGRSVPRRYGTELLALLASPPAAPEREPRGKFVPDKVREERIRQLRTRRDEVAAALGLDPGVLAPKWVLEAVADRRPSGVAEIERCLERRWRAGTLAQPLLGVVAGWDAVSEAGDAGAA
ncbi:MAG: ribonuclease D [Acidobacteriota bacterium]